MSFKLWFMAVGAPITSWIMMAISIGFFISTIWKSGRKARVTAGMIFIFLAVVLLIVLIMPYNWTVAYNLGG